jgi:4-amino-4-deoxy-L-arabinose transferase-like glycosyltransferase
LYWDYAFILALAAVIWCTNAVWLKLDTRPPVWDMAMHQSYALNYLPAVGLPSTDVGPFWTWSGTYPPFVHVLIAVLYLMFHPGPQVAAFVNLPATVLLLWAVYGLGSDLAGPKAGRWACLFTALTPYLFWMSRETILDYWLAAWVAASLVILRRSDAFRKRNSSIVLGILFALGLLTKWLFAGFLFFPVLYVFVSGRVWRDTTRLLNFGMTLSISIVLSGIWYFPNLTLLLRYFAENARIGEIEGEPPVLSFRSLIYYVRLLEGYQLFALLFLLLAIALVVTYKKGLIHDARFLGVAVGGAWMVVTLIRTKDPRFTMPLLGLLCIIPGAWIQTWTQAWPSKAAKALLASVLCFQAYMINFGISWLPQEVILAEGYQGSLRWDWNLYLQHYFHILGPPRRENWRQTEILNRMIQDATQTGLRRAMALVPDRPRFSATNFQLYARLLAIPCQVGRLILTPDGIYPLEAVDYVVTTEGDQGMSWTTTTSKELTRIVEESPGFQLVGRFPLPEGDSAHLYRVTREKGPFGR